MSEEKKETKDTGFTFEDKSVVDEKEKTKLGDVLKAKDVSLVVKIIGCVLYVVACVFFCILSKRMPNLDEALVLLIMSHGISSFFIGVTFNTFLEKLNFNKKEL